MSANLLILAGGMSSRMKKALSGQHSLHSELLEQADNLPKGMIGLGKNGRPFLDYLLYNASQAGIKEVILLLNPKDEVTQPYFERKSAEGKCWGLTVKYARQHIPENREKPLGTADAVLQAIQQHPEWKNKRFVVCNSDNLYPVEAFKMLLKNAHSNALVDWDTSVYEVERVRNCAIIKKDEQGFLIDLIEKPTDEEWDKMAKNAKRLGSSWNIFVFQSDEIVPFLEKTPLDPVRNEKELPNAVRLMAKEKLNAVYCVEMKGLIPDLTSKTDIAEIQKYLENKFSDF